MKDEQSVFEKDNNFHKQKQKKREIQYSRRVKQMDINNIEYYKRLLNMVRKYPTPFMQHAKGWIIAKIDNLRKNNEQR